MPRELLNPNHIFRECDARAIFGFSTTQLRIKIKAGVIPAPKQLAPPPSRARGWWGWQINDWTAKVDAAQEKWAADAQNFYVPKPPKSNKKSLTASKRAAKA